MYLAASALLIGNMLRKSPAESFSGLAVVALGVPVYFYFRSLNRARIDAVVRSS